MTEDDKIKLTPEQKRKIIHDWFEYPLATRLRYWGETDYNQHNDYISSALFKEMKLGAKRTK